MFRTSFRTSFLNDFIERTFDAPFGPGAERPDAGNAERGGGADDDVIPFGCHEWTSVRFQIKALSALARLRLLKVLTGTSSSPHSSPP